MLFSPKWVRLLPENLRPDKKRVQMLEKLRSQYEIPHELMMMRVAQSKATMRKVQRTALEYFRRHNPSSPEKELLRMVLISRLNISQLTNPYELSIYNPSEEEIDEVMSKINSFDDLINYIASMDDQEPSLPDPMELGRRIDEILEEEFEE